ncbi:hypothetical protein BABINDRAFT_161913 [Babjeviella inositovora NRRL Y-12698]|uniref:Major facilitator superfamily (MFS) profile domain-containing protein n=1 Tax=Babjeviella inositovora NRRL Y-12698 TaxID=984486 RepID=A0A1E3QR30_9ASCO|nr:uncharacterized protein BABINDRAFT_161913 [Babjeviella inositovora NRRL Y-12698]ODQ79522.1 hypothetical protein BABINDRAFT_161913 [Babjeviella inositovora NRRL Y-12698]
MSQPSDTSLASLPSFTSNTLSTLEGKHGAASSRRRGSVSSINSVVSRAAVDAYPGLNEEEINFKRIQTRSSIIDTLQRRASRTASRVEVADDEENQDPLGKSADDKDQEDDVLPLKDYGTEFASLDPELVTWDGPDDPEYPRNWSPARKWTSTIIVSLYTFVSPYSSSVISLGGSMIAEEFGINRTYMKALLVSIFVLAWVIGPVFVAPMSELYGRKVMLNSSIYFLLAFNFGCAFSQNTAQMLVFRFLAGLGGCTPLSVGAGVLGDCFDNKERNFAMGLYATGPTLGPAVAPIVTGFIVQNCDWRWSFYVCCILNGVVAITGTLFFEETYPPTLLKQKAARLRKLHNNPNLKCIYEIADGETVAGRFYVNLTRPVKLLLFHPMVFGLGSFMAFVYGFMYLMIVTIPTIWTEVYGFDKAIAGLLFLPMGIGYVLGIVFWTWSCEVCYEKLVEKNGGVAKPEYRLPMLCFTGILIPVGLFWYGWSAEKHLHWIMPSIGTAIFGFGLVAVFQTIQNYLIDMSPLFAASSIGAASLFRSCFGFGFPLFANQMYAKLGYGWGNTLCGFLALGLGIPFPVFVIMYGERLRLWANKNMERDIAKRREKNLKRLQAKNETQEK